MNNELIKITLRRLHLLPVPGTLSSPIFGASLNLELGQLGYRVVNHDKATNLNSEQYSLIRDTLLEMRGGNVNYVPLFANFPDEAPNDYGYLLRRVLGFFGIDTFNEADFGANPISQFQNNDLYKAVVATQEQKATDSKTVWVNLEVVSYGEAEVRLAGWVRSLFYSSTPVQETLWVDINTILDTVNFNVDFSKIVIKESLVRLAHRYWKGFDLLKVTTPTDILRLLAYDRGQDVSLATLIDLKGLKLSKPKRREIIRVLNAATNLEEDLLRYRGLWISISDFLHVGDYIKQAPKVVQAFDDLRNDRIKSFESKVVNAPSIADQLSLLKGRPSVLLRKLTQLKVTSKADADLVNEAIKGIDPEKVPLPLLLQVQAALSYNLGGKDRVVINKAGKSYNIVAAKSTIYTHIFQSLQELIFSKLRGLKPEWNQDTLVWLDPQLDKIVIPFQARKQSDGFLTLARGTRVKLDPETTIRTFVYWKQTKQSTDLDLSLQYMDKEFIPRGRVSWNSYGSQSAIVHSGDIQDGRLGATEFLDIKLGDLKKELFSIDSYHRASDCPYLIVSILHFCGEKLEELESCFSGWMVRDNSNSDAKLFDPKTVANKIAVGKGKNWIPFLIDLANMELVFVDIYSNGGRVIESLKHLPKLAEGLSNYYLSKPTYGQLARSMALANTSYSGLTEDREQAQITIGVDDSCTINVLNLVGDQITTLG